MIEHHEVTANSRIGVGGTTTLLSRLARGAFIASLMALGACTLFAIAGCVADKPGVGGSSASSIKTSNVEPVGLILVVPDSFQDTDDDRWLDTAQVVAYVTGHAGPRGELLPVEADGTFVFALRAAAHGTGTNPSQAQAGGKNMPVGNDLLTTWEFSKEDAAAQLTRLGPGPGFVFTLTLPKELQGKSPRTTAELGCVFKSAQGRQLRPARSESIVFGVSRP